MTDLMTAKEAFEKSVETKLDNITALAESQWRIVCSNIHYAVDIGHVFVDISGSPYDSVKDRLKNLGYKVEQHSSFFSVGWWWK